MPRLDRAVTDVAAPPDAVYEALVDGDALASWLPPEGMTGELSDFDAREGGGFTMTLTYDEGSAGRGKTTGDSDVTHVELDELVPGHRIVWGVEFDSEDPDHAGRMTMTWTLTPRDGGTRVAIDATDVPAGIDPDLHQQGLNASLANLAAYCEENA
ncbi:SRPBCC domain-containing protein [Nocardioides sp.]|uniref:SRPBCC domain-containing protein n=1 Tax=Nocardioides sp. TaxID=35761 RepID=UPI002ED38942